MINLKSVLRYVLSRNPWEWALYGFVIICAIRPWVISTALFPHDPAAVHVIYRSPMGDIEYFPEINALGRGVLGEHAVYELQNEGVMSFPMASLVPHAIGTAIFGNYWGYVWADVAVTLAFFLLFREWCRLFSASDGWANFIAAIFACGLPDIYVNLGQIWGQRLPRPFVSDLYFIAGITLLTWMTWKPERMRLLWAWLGIGAIFALCLQSFIYYMPVLVLAVGYSVITWVSQNFREMATAFSRIGTALLLFVVLIIPFLCQRAFESPDAQGRLGVFPVDRWTIWMSPIWRDPEGTFLLGTYCVIMLGILNVFAKRLRMPPVPWRLIFLMAALQFGALLAMPLTATLTGKLIQPYHFLTVSRSIQTCLLVALISYIVGGLIPRFKLARVFAAALLAISFCIVTKREIAADVAIRHLRPDIYTPPGPGYHEAFANLVRELDRDIYKDDKVAATTDHQVYSYWVGFHRGFAFFPDNFLTTLSDRQIEDRLLWFGREEGLDADSLARFLNQKATMVFWLGSDLYQCSPVYQKDPLSDYQPTDVARNFDHPPDLGSFALALPNSVVLRLQDRYAQIKASPESERPRLDLIILAADQKHYPLPDPDSSLYRLTYHDEYFRVWQTIK